ncbi:MAG: helix-turn-helix domain-containing protein [Bacteroidetes bacterium]|nr:helix-turn-helix domain-containing protein [Bacteroidota bacterium]
MDTIIDNPFAVLDRRLNRIENLLLDLKHSPKETSNHHDPDLLDIKGASHLLGISIDGIYGKIHDKTIPHIKRKGVKKIYFSRAALLSWLNEGEQKTRKQIKEEAKEAQIKK